MISASASGAPAGASSGQFTGVPSSSVPPLDPTTGFFTQPWYYFFLLLWAKLGKGMTSPASVAVPVQSMLSGGQPVTLVSAATGEAIGNLSFGNVVAEAQQALAALVTSPTTLVMPSNGMLVVAGGGQVELARSPGPFVIASLVGGSFWLLAGDTVRVTWFGAAAPTLTLFPFSIT